MYIYIIYFPFVNIVYFTIPCFMNTVRLIGIIMIMIIIMVMIIMIIIICIIIIIITRLFSYSYSANRSNDGWLIDS